MPEQSVKIELVPSNGIGASMLDAQTANLAHELRAIRSVHVERIAQPAPDDTKALDATTIQTLLVSLGGAGGALTALVGVLHGWIERGHTLELEKDGIKIKANNATKILSSSS